MNLLASRRVSDIMAEHKATSGFDYMRLALSIAVLGLHSVSTSYGKANEVFLLEPPLRGLTTMVLPMFFALSGFLVSASLFRVSLGVFVGHRVLRLVPALAVETTLCALLLGTMLTSMPLDQYFRHEEFRTYFLNIVGNIHFNLPGMFEQNPFPRIVNVSLWTIPYELECYLTLIVLALVGAFRNRWIFLAIVVAIQVGILGYDMLHHTGPPMDGVVPPRLLVVSFLWGIVMYVFRDKLVLNAAYIIGAVIASYILLSFAKGTYLAPIPVAYVTMALGLATPPRSKFLLGGDYSYGIYLYAWPMQQTFAMLFPGLREWYWNLPVTLLMTACFAAFSWHCVEKHVMKLKKHLPPLAQRLAWVNPANTVPRLVARMAPAQKSS